MGRIDRIAEPWGTRTPYGPGETWPTRVDSYLADGLDEHDVDRWVQSATVLHSNGDALDIAVKDGRIAGVRGRAGDRVNHGRLGPKDLYGWQANHSPDRLTEPLVRRGGELVPADWDTAMDAVAGRTRELLDERGPGSVGFYTTGQLFLEEYYTLAVIAHGGIGTNHLDGNTRLCTATAGESLKESFGSDGQPGSYTDVDHADVIALYGHNVAETQTVLWTRMLDRLAGPNPPRLLCVDPRQTPVADAATVHLAPRPGTNLMLMNALLHEIVAHDWVDHDWVSRHTTGFDDLRAQVADCPPERAAEVCDVPAGDIRAAAQLLGSAERLLSTVLQGFYQSHQATAAAVQVNNVHLVRGMLGRPGCGVLQMNGQPTAQNTRECGADGDLPGFRNWANPAHVEDLARLWNVDPLRIPHYGPPTNLMQILRYAEQGSIRFLYVTGTNPAVSLPELARVRRVLAQERLFLVVQDIFLTETAQLADVVLPAATWGEKTGTFTNVDRTVHLSEKAVDPPGGARPDLDILLDYARRLELADQDGAPLVTWTDAEGAFEAWKACSAGRPCDYSGLSYDQLRGRSGIQWPVNDAHPGGTERLYADGVFPTDPGYCETYGRDLVTGAPVEPTAYRAANPSGRALIKPAEYVPPHEPPDDAHPFVLTTGRTLYHFHTRTKTGRAPQLQRAAPDVWVEVSDDDARAHGWDEGDLLRITTERGSVEARLRISGIRPGVVFLPFHYGYWDTPGGYRPGGANSADGAHGRAANELTPTDWDPASKQPLFKTAAAAVERIAAGDGSPAPAPTTTASRPVRDVGTHTRGDERSLALETLPDGGAR
ncbi:molybdopterin oxidoreductase family protein [Jiangella mangrovi]|uniref:Anaerobic selenocysteine-containing dehydrogenase n=1 Tax=Jiangella mangrovi TaxID=1524084 RepID=A0A7W9LM38_9ACTN|nr:nitrate reductase [Jiangella mangrovi]MBB5788863.1 anaerobic selenocysteine-containing dehydrogenase [Jiangella mangrovi]